MTRRTQATSLLALAAGAALVVGAFMPGRAQAPQEVGNPTGGPPSSGPLTVGTTTPPEPQPQFPVTKLALGEKPPQFVVVSFDGSCETPEGTMRHYLDTAKQVSGHFTFNLSGLCVLPRNDMKMNYLPPGHEPGTSDIGFAVPEWVSSRIVTWSEAYRTGHEIGTHYLGHFCGATGVNTWSTADWTSEITQFNEFITNWQKYNPDLASKLPALPFDTSVIKGGRTPCLEGQRDQMYPAMTAAGYTYDSSNSGKLTWPKKVDGYNLWDFPLEEIKLHGADMNVLSMDYNFLANLNDGQTEATPEHCAAIENKVYQSYMDAGEALYAGNRAPLFIGNHFNDWACGAFQNSLSTFVTDFKARHPDVQFVSNLDLERWLEAQDPQVLANLQALPVQTY